MSIPPTDWKKVFFVTAFAIGFGMIGFKVQDYAINLHKVRTAPVDVGPPT